LTRLRSTSFSKIILLHGVRGMTVFSILFLWTFRRKLYFDKNSTLLKYQLFNGSRNHDVFQFSMCLGCLKSELFGRTQAYHLHLDDLGNMQSWEIWGTHYVATVGRVAQSV
jgi:hypothetical protein